MGKVLAWQAAGWSLIPAVSKSYFLPWAEGAKQKSTLTQRDGALACQK